MFNSQNNLSILKKALAVIAEEEEAALPADSEVSHITFSKEFEIKMERLIKQQKRSYYSLINTVGKRVACVIIAIILAITTATFSVKALREAVINFLLETFEKFSTVSFNEESNDFIDTYYAPTYIPQGYELKQAEKLATYHRLQYVSKNSYIYFSQNTRDNYLVYLDTEDFGKEILTVSGLGAYIFEKENKTVLFWSDNKYGYTITATERLSKEEMIKIAESVKSE